MSDALADGPLPAEEAERFLGLLGVPRRPPGRDALFELVRAHLERVPFENVSKLHRLRRSGLRGIPDLAEHLEGIERHRFGGTCYTNNYYLRRLLESLGYDVALCGCDMTRPDVHLVSLVRLEGREYVVDGGYGAPFLEPMPRDLGHDHEIVWGRERYVLRPRDSQGRSRLDMYRDGALRHGYTLKPEPRRIAEFAGVVAYSFAPAATFMNAVVIIRFFPGGSLTLRNLTLNETRGATSRDEPIASADALPETIERCFGIPTQIAREATAGIDLSRDPWSPAPPEAR